MKPWRQLPRLHVIPLRCPPTKRSAKCNLTRFRLLSLLSALPLGSLLAVSLSRSASRARVLRACRKGTRIRSPGAATTALTAAVAGLRQDQRAVLEWKTGRRRPRIRRDSKAVGNAPGQINGNRGERYRDVTELLAPERSRAHIPRPSPSRETQIFCESWNVVWSAPAHRATSCPVRCTGNSGGERALHG